MPSGSDALLPDQLDLEDDHTSTPRPRKRIRNVVSSPPLSEEEDIVDNENTPRPPPELRREGSWSKSNWVTSRSDKPEAF